MFSPDKASQFLSTALQKGGDWADLFIEETIKNKGELTDKKIKSLSQQQIAGAGIRVVSNQMEFYGHTNNLTEAGLSKLAREIADSVAATNANQTVNLETTKVELNHQPTKDPNGISWEDKIALLRQADEISRQTSPQIVQVNASYTDEQQHVLIANSNGLYKQDTRTRGRFGITAVAADGNEKQMGYESPGAQRGYEFFENLDIKELAQKSSERALTMLKAEYAPQGRMSVIIDSGFGGVIFHEACGHSLEAEAVAKNATVFAHSLGTSIAADCVSAVDDGTLDFEWGSSTIDDEGTATQRNLLIDKGVLKSFLVDRLNGERIGQQPTGSSRRESYRFSPTSRMNNTYILPGNDNLEEMIASTDYGLYAKVMGGGSVNPATGEFNFAVTEGYLVKDGKILQPVRGAVLIGRGDEILKKIDRVGSELKLAQGVCGAASGWVPVDVGQPAIRVQNLLVGGRS